MTFFYDLNKRMAELSQKQTLAEHSVPAVQPTKKSPMTQALNESAVAEASYSAKAARAGKDIGKPGKNFSKIAADAGKRYGSKAAGERVAGAVLNKLRHPSESVEEAAKWRDPKYKDKLYTQEPPDYNDTREYDNAMWNPKPKGYQGRKELPGGGEFDRNDPLVKGFGRSGTGSPVEKGPRKGLPTRDQITSLKGSIKSARGTHAEPSLPEEGGIPMTAKQKSFAALAPPKDKITFADKIAGAKQEVEEMLGDVAAEAIKSALSPKQKKLDRNNNGRLDAQDFEMLRRGGKKQVADEGWDDMVKDVQARAAKPKVGDVKRGARHDIETTATGIRATRRHDDETDEQPTGEKRKAGRPKGAPKGPERVTGKAYKHKGGRVKEDGMEDMIEPHDSGEYDHEGEMAKDSIKTVVRHAQALEKILGDNDNLPEWVQSKLAKIESMMTAVDDYMQNQEGDDEMAMDEEKTSTRDSRAERAGRKVAKDIEYDEKKKDGIHGKRRGSEDDRAEKAGKRVTKDIEYDEKKKEKKVDETTTSGSVATGGDAPKAGKGGMQVGKGIYDSLNRKLENMISESMSINVSMTNDDNGSHKNITVTAADEDAEMLAQLLRSAGLGGGAAHDHGHEEPCPDCGSTDCGCDEGVAEAYGDTTATQNEPNWPTDTETSDDALQYSGGLNGPKSTGQTTVPVIAHQGERTGVDDEELRRMMEMAGIQQDLKPWERTMKEEAVEEGVVDTVKDVVKKGIDALKGPDDDKLLSKLEKETGGKRPEKKDEKMQESLMKEFANFRI